MKLNPDCARDTMLVLEATTNLWVDKHEKWERLLFYGNSLYSISMKPELKEKYDVPTIAYTLIQLAESGYIRMNFECEKDGPLSISFGNILYVTPKGHSFISSISNDTIWSNKVKPILSTIGNISLSIIEAISKGITDSAIDHAIQAHLG